MHVLADGMGGHQGGEVASLEATSTILESGKISSIAEMVKSVSKANQAIIKRAKKDMKKYLIILKVTLQLDIIDIAPLEIIL